MIHLRHSRRRFLTGLGGALGATAAGTSLLGARARADGAEPEPVDPADRRLLFVVGALGGASIIDSFLPVSTDEISDPDAAASLNAYAPEQLVQPTGSNIRCVRPLGETAFLTSDYSIQDFLEAHYADMTIVTQEGTSVNHGVAQKRAMTGAGIDRGRTIAEAVAERYGLGLPLANCNMANGGYVEPGDDRGLAGYARSEIIASPMTYAMATHGSRGLVGAPPLGRIEQARAVREQLEEVSPFGQTYREAPLRERVLQMRREVAPQLEQLDAITKLMLMSPDDLSPEYGLEGSPLHDELRNAFPGLREDNWQQQGALAFALAYYGMTAASTISLSFSPAFVGDEIVGAPLAFDFSHSLHRPAQNVMWGRVLKVVDGLVNLLKRYDYLGDPSMGKMWDRSLIYIATDFGRDKVRPAGNPYFGTGHHLNNGTLLLSPLLQGNRVFGGVDPDTLLTYGFDGRTGEDRPDTLMREGEIYSLIAQAMDIDFSGRRDMSAVLA
ncbi:MAG: hypothetical protein AAGF11_20745 [Myxococcota bacterium]